MTRKPCPSCGSSSLRGCLCGTVRVMKAVAREVEAAEQIVEAARRSGHFRELVAEYDRAVREREECDISRRQSGG